jgi:hypothetical protein
LWNRTDPTDPMGGDWRHLTAVRWT